jgi:transposase
MLKSILSTQHNNQINEQLYTNDIQNQQLIAENKLLKEQNQQLQEAYDFLQTQVDALRRMIFGAKAERYLDPESRQPSLLDENSFTDADNQGVHIPEAAIQIASHLRKKKPNPNKVLPRRVVVIKVPESDMLCECGACKKVIKTEVRELINYIPAVFEIIEQHREVVACPSCENGVVTAASPLQILPKVGVTENLLSYIIVSKFVDRVRRS